MGMERHRQGRRADGSGAGDQLGDEPGMTAMHAVEVADGDERASGVGGEVMDVLDRNHRRASP